MPDAVPRPSRKGNVGVGMPPTLFVVKIIIDIKTIVDIDDHDVMINDHDVIINDHDKDDQNFEVTTWTLSKLNRSGSKRSGSGKVLGSLC